MGGVWTVRRELKEEGVELQEMVEAYHAAPGEALELRIRDAAIGLLYGDASPLGYSRLDADQCQQLMLKVFVAPGRDGLTEFSRSLRRYRPDAPGRDGIPVPFFSYLFRLIRLRTRDLFRSARRNREVPQDLASDGGPMPYPEASAVGNPAPLAVEPAVLRSLLAEHLAPLILQACFAIRNRAYRDPFMFLLLYRGNVPQQELAELFGIAAASISVNLKRARGEFARRLCELLGGNVDQDAFLEAVRRLSMTIDTRFGSGLPLELERDVARARFTDGMSRAEVCSRFSIDAATLADMEKTVRDRFMEEARRLVPTGSRSLQPKEDDMDGFAEFQRYLLEAPSGGERVRSGLGLEPEEFLCFEMIKHILPTGVQARRFVLQARLETVPPGALGQFCLEHEVEAADLARLLRDAPADHPVLAALEAFLAPVPD
jgi:DNA-directed RNA polymerase specialized sigma24 family protein